MKFKVFSSFAVLFSCAMLFAMDAMAEERSGFEARLAFTGVVQSEYRSGFDIGHNYRGDTAADGETIKLHTRDHYGKFADHYGIGGSLTLGYRFGYLGLYLEGDIHSMIDKNRKNNDFGDSWYAAGGYIAVAAHVPLPSNFELSFKAGVGMYYVSSDSYDPSSGMMWESSTTTQLKDIEVYDSGTLKTASGSTGIIPALKASVSATYYFLDCLGVGLSMEYRAAFPDVTHYATKYDRAMDVSYFGSVPENRVIHQLVPGVYLNLVL